MSNYTSFVEFVKSIYSNSEKVALHEPVFLGNEKRYLIDCIETTFVSSVGKYVDRLETEIAQLTETSKAIAVVNGTSALQVSLKLAGVNPGDEVLTQALSFIATTNSIKYNSAQPVFIDVDKDTMGMSPEALNHFLKTNAIKKGEQSYNRITGRRISACLPMHTFGFMCRIEEIVKICEEWNIVVVEDAAESLGSFYQGRPAGSFGKLGALSFNGNKIITSGGGGAIVSQDLALAERAKHLTTTAKVAHQWEYFHDEIGYNFRMPNINAALLCAQIENFDIIKESKREIYNLYKYHLSDGPLRLKPIPENTSWNYWLISIELNNRAEKEDFLEFTNKNGIMTRPIWQLMYRLPMYKNCQRDKQQNAEFLEERIVNIPSSARQL